MKRKLIFQKEIDQMLATPDDLHKVVNGRTVAKDWNELSEDEQERHHDWMEDSSTLPSEAILIQVAKSFGTDEVIPNDQQLLQWTVNRIMSGDKAVLARVEALCK